MLQRIQIVYLTYNQLHIVKDYYNLKYNNGKSKALIEGKNLNILGTSEQIEDVTKYIKDEDWDYKILKFKTKI